MKKRIPTSITIHGGDQIIMADSKQPPPIPVVLELAPLPREQVGPFFILGIEKGGKPEQVEANWAQRVIWARKKSIPVALEDINWAREVLNDPEKRRYSEVSTLNLDLNGDTLRQLQEKDVESSLHEITALLLEEEKDLSGYSPPVEIPSLENLRDGIVVPEIPREFPIVAHLLVEIANTAIDPWDLEGFDR